MDSKASINLSADSCTKPEVRVKTFLYPNRIVLKRKSIENWLRRNGMNYYDVAYYLGIKKQQLIHMLRVGKSFSEKQIRELTALMGARAMFFAIYFPSKAERKRVFRETFGYELYEEERRGRRQRIRWTK